MAMKTLRPNSFTAIPTFVPWSKRFNYFVEAQKPVDTFMLDDNELAKFRKGKSAIPYGGFDERRLHRERGRLPYDGEWSLVVVNHNEEPVTIYYEVSNAI